MQPTKDGDGLPPTAVREVLLLSTLAHPNIVRLEKAHINHAEGTLSLVRARGSAASLCGCAWQLTHR